MYKKVSLQFPSLNILPNKFMSIISLLHIESPRANNLMDTKSKTVNQSFCNNSMDTKSKTANQSCCNNFMDAKSKTADDVKPDSSEGLFSTPPLLLAILAVTFVLQIYQLSDQPRALAFVFFAYGNLLLLFWCLHRLDKEAENSKRREGLKGAVWLLSSTLVLTLTFRVAGMMPLAVRVLLWSMAGASVSFTTYAFFMSRGNCKSDSVSDVAVSRKTLEA